MWEEPTGCPLTRGFGVRLHLWLPILATQRQLPQWNHVLKGSKDMHQRVEKGQKIKCKGQIWAAAQISSPCQISPPISALPVKLKRTQLKKALPLKLCLLYQSNKGQMLGMPRTC